ncbi:MAG: hypothetical protein H6566_20260 [Lewinellaceae bacterium]|nr:hypothetical protein [Lewinellaceae bacterium]
MKKLDAPHSDDELFLFSLLFQTYFHWSIIKSLNNKEKSRLPPHHTNSIRGVSQRKNLLKIATFWKAGNRPGKGITTAP